MTELNKSQLINCSIVICSVGNLFNRVIFQLRSVHLFFVQLLIYSIDFCSVSFLFKSFVQLSLFKTTSIIWQGRIFTHPKPAGFIFALMVSPVAGYPRQHTAEISRLHGRRSPAAVLPLGVSLIMTFCLSVGGTGDCMSLFRWRACPLNMTFSTVHISLATKKNSFLESALCYFAFTEWRKPQRLLRRANQSREPCSVYRAKGSPNHRGGVLLLYSGPSSSLTLWLVDRNFTV